jgi:DNA uptake protein ComE-like DNA-binding protein
LDTLNKGNLKEIKSLKGIGDARAQKIIDHLISNGKFADFMQLEQLGINKRVIDGIVASKL